MTNQYAKGYSGKTYYGACKFTDVVKYIACNKNGIPNDPQKPMVTSGIRLSSAAMITCGFKKVQAQVHDLTKRCLVYGN